MNLLPTNKRIACLWFPDWPLQYRLAARRELVRAVLLLTEKTARGEFVVFANRTAARRGIGPGMPLTEARSLVSRRDAVEIDSMRPEADRAALEALALFCERYSPCVGLEDGDCRIFCGAKDAALQKRPIAAKNGTVPLGNSPQSLLLDMTGIAHLFGGESSLADLMQTELTARQFAVRIALAESVGAAWAAAHYCGTGFQPVGTIDFQSVAAHCRTGFQPIMTDWKSVLQDLPIEGLRPGETTVEKLHRLGIRTIRQICGLNRSSLSARFGEEIARRLDQFTGERSELIVPCHPPPKFVVEQSLENGVSRTDIIEKWRSMLLDRLTGLLQEHRLGTRHLHCELITDRKTRHDVAIRFCEATADARHIGDLLRLKFERFRLDAPLVGMRMEALETSQLEQPQQEFFDGESHELNRQLSALLNRLSSRLGCQSTVRPRLVADAVPERAVEYIPVTDDAFRSSPRPLGEGPGVRAGFEQLDRPPCLFSQPQAVEVIAVVPDGPPAVLFLGDTHFDIVQSWGPERIETGWWQGPSVRREYFHVATADGRRFWLFRQIADGRWFLQGGML
jgi:protein ImuB